MTIAGIIKNEIRKTALCLLAFLVLLSALTGCSKLSAIGSFPDPEPISETTAPATTSAATEESTAEEEYAFEKYGIRMLYTEYSTCFSAIGYDFDDGILQVTFRNSGVTYQYYDVSGDAWMSLASSRSPGEYFQSEIKGNYEYARMD